jgi:uncharacterized protein (DUF2267 family)
MAIDLAQYQSGKWRPLFKKMEETMSAVGLEGLERTVHLTHVWINDLNDRIAWNDKSRSYRLLRAVLHALRDWLEVDESANLAAQLPGLLRGAYYDQWRPATTPVKKRNRQAFLEHVEKEFARDPLHDTAECVTAVFQLLSEKITFGEIEDVWRAMPADIRELWPLMKKTTVDVGR